MNVHTSIILIIFIVSITMICMRLGEFENYINIEDTSIQPTTNRVFSKLYNIDEQLVTNSKNLGWKKFWRQNYSKEDPNIEKQFNHTEWTHKAIPPLLYDGIRDISKCPLV